MYNPTTIPSVTSPTSIGGDIVAVSVTGLSLAGWLPPIAAAFTIIWIGLQIYTWVINKQWKKRNDPK